MKDWKRWIAVRLVYEILNRMNWNLKRMDQIMDNLKEYQLKECEIEPKSAKECEIESQRV